MRIAGHLTTAAALILAAAAVVSQVSCTRRCSGQILEVSQPINVRTLSVETAGGEVLWKFKADGSPLSDVFYGEVPSGAAQLFPVGGAVPRAFREQEDVIVRVYSDNDFYFIHGAAGGPRSFCGGTYHAGSIRSLTEPASTKRHQ
jgi:hypothetical protein